MDGRYSGQPFADWVKEQRPKLKVEVVKRSDDMEGSEVLPRRWVVERTFGWLMQQRCLVRDYEKTEASAQDWIYITMIYLKGTSGNLVFTHAKYIKPRIQQSHSDFSWVSRGALKTRKLA